MSDQHRQDYCAPWQVALREADGAAVCADVDCDLSGGYAHVGECASCDCGKQHAIDECPVRRGMSLTPSEVALAKVLAAWEAWPGDLDHHRETILKIGEALTAHLLLESGQLSAEGRALLDRARKAGVL